MLYNAYELQRTMLSGAAAWASITSELLTNPSLPMGYFGIGPVMASALDVFAHARHRASRPVSGLAGRRVGTRRGPPPSHGHEVPQWRDGSLAPAYRCGGSAGLAAVAGGVTCFPFNPWQDIAAGT